MYSLGSVLHFLLLGTRPYGKMKRRDAAATLARGIPPELPQDLVRAADPAVAALVDAIERCHAPHPRDRPPAREIADALGAAAAALDEQARPEHP